MSDLIDRQAAIDALDKQFWSNINIPICKEIRSAVKNTIKQLPSAQSERKTGRWIYGENDVAMCDGYWCDKCGFFVPWDYQHKAIDFIKDYHCCPNCEAKMLTYTGAEVEHE